LPPDTLAGRIEIIVCVGAVFGDSLFQVLLLGLKDSQFSAQEVKPALSDDPKVGQGGDEVWTQNTDILRSRRSSKGDRVPAAMMVLKAVIFAVVKSA
jgi:hypothetical protein